MCIHCTEVVLYDREEEASTAIPPIIVGSDLRVLALGVVQLFFSFSFGPVCLSVCDLPVGRFVAVVHADDLLPIFRWGGAGGHSIRG